MMESVHARPNADDGIAQLQRVVDFCRASWTWTQAMATMDREMLGGFTRNRAAFVAENGG
jgi:hypothetical protein